MEEKEETKKELYTVLRVVEELYEVEAESPEAAKLAAGLKGNPSSVTVVRETARVKKA